MTSRQSGLFAGCLADSLQVVCSAFDRRFGDIRKMSKSTWCNVCVHSSLSIEESFKIVVDVMWLNFFVDCR